MNGLVGKIQRFSTKDGPGIRTTVFMVGCNLRCKWCANPEWMLPGKKTLYHKEKCKHCGCCLSYEGIHIQEVGVQIDRSVCRSLYELENICPFDAYENIGQEMSAQELVNELVKDKDFYETSHGGVTFSGGDPLLQADFVLECTKLLHEHHIHVCLDTAGSCEFHEVLDEVDLVLLDIKAFDAKMHKDCTGIDNQLILENAKKIKKPMIVRMILVPDCNDDLMDIQKRIDFVKNTSCIQIDFLKYHILGVSKYEQLGLVYPCHTKELKDSILQDAILYAQKQNIKTTIGGS
ncbi:MAG: glycyl-radical enzyme activating protein [Floccifex sp.]